MGTGREAGKGGARVLARWASLAYQQNADGPNSTLGSRLFLPVLGVKGAY